MHAAAVQRERKVAERAAAREREAAWSFRQHCQTLERRRVHAVRYVVQRQQIANLTPLALTDGKTANDIVKHLVDLSLDDVEFARTLRGVVSGPWTAIVFVNLTNLIGHLGGFFFSFILLYHAIDVCCV